MARTGYKITVYLDDNPNSSGYMETYEERVLDENTCPISEDDLVLVSSECEVVYSGRTGYRINTYYNRTTGEYQQTKELDPECEPSSDEEIWVPSGSPFCETTEQGVNTGYMVQLVVQMNQLLPNYGETKYNRWKSPECGANNCAIWDDLQQQCHISVINCVATFDGTADVTQIDINPLSATYNQTRTINKQSNDCENCTQTTFSWQLVGDMCGDDELLCSNGLQQVSTNSYTVHRKYKTIGNSTPVPMDEYQIVLKIEDDEDCGYIRPMYEMRRMPGEYICDFETYTKYEKYSQYVSYDSGVTWSLVSPEVSQRGDVIAYDSYDCGKPMYRWVFNGEYMCEDNGDDGKVRYYNSFSDGEFSDLVSSVPCNESDVLSGSEVTSVQQTLYRRVGDCVSVVSGTNITKNSSSSKMVVWLGDYTEEIGDITEYEGVVLDIPERVKKLTRINRTTTFENIVMMPQYPVSATSVFQNGANGYCAIWVAADVYEAWHDDEYWGRFSGSSTTAKLLPMNNDTVSWKAKVEMKSDFNEWAYFIPDGEDSTTITSEEGRYGRAIMTKITLSDKIRTISRDSFGDRNNGYRNAARLKEIDFGHGIETIGSSAFSYNYFTSVHIPDSVRTIGNNAFFNYSHTISSITFDDGVETIGDYAFSGNTCSAITLPDSVKTIGNYAFYGYSGGLVRLEIGSGCTSIGSYVARGVAEVVVKALTPPTVRSYSFGTDYLPHIYVPCESYEDYVEQWADFASRIAPYGCSGVEVTIAILHQTDGTDIEITKPIEYRRKVLRPSDIDSYSSTTSAITVTDECTEFAIRSIYDYSGVDHITFEGVIPPEFTNLLTSNRFVNNNQIVYVPCEGYDIYRFDLNEVLTSWDDTDKLVRVNDSCVGSLEYEWVTESSWCNSESGKAVETQRKHLIWGGESYPTVETRDVETTDCIEISNNGFTFDSDNTWAGHNSSTMSFKYLADGGFTVTLYQDYNPRYGIRGYVDIYDESGTKIATSYRNDGATVELESDKTYTVKNVEPLAGGSGKIKFNF